LPLYNNIRIPQDMYAKKTRALDWESLDQPPVVLQQQSMPVSVERRKVGGKRRRRSSPLKKATLELSPIAEGVE